VAGAVEDRGMTRALTQRTGNQCAIATIAMATGREYDEVLATGLETKAFKEGVGCNSEKKILRALGLSDDRESGDFVEMHRPSMLTPEYFRSIAWGRRAILTVPSLNIPGGWHSIYYDGREMFDPNPPEKARYTKFDEVLPDEVILFREAA
jgi:hypothetical protein